MGKNGIDKLIIALLIVIALIFLALWRLEAYVCASEEDYSCNHAVTPTETAPTDVILEITPTDSPTAIPTVQPTIQPTEELPPQINTAATADNTAGQSANMPVSPPDTGRAN